MRVLYNFVQNGTRTGGNNFVNGDQRVTSSSVVRKFNNKIYKTHRSKYLQRSFAAL